MMHHLMMYIAIIYDEPPANLLGGETALVDFRPPSTKPDEVFSGDETVEFGMKVNESETSFVRAGGKTSKPDPGSQPIDFQSGLIVEPKRGRIVLFSAGGENFHAPMEVKRGGRPTFHVWFTCKQANAREARSRQS